MDYGNAGDPYYDGQPTISAMKLKPTSCGMVQAAQMTRCSWRENDNFPSDMTE